MLELGLQTPTTVLTATLLWMDPADEHKPVCSRKSSPFRSRKVHTETLNRLLIPSRNLRFVFDTRTSESFCLHLQLKQLLTNSNIYSSSHYRYHKFHGCNTADVLSIFWRPCERPGFWRNADCRYSQKLSLNGHGLILSRHVEVFVCMNFPSSRYFYWHRGIYFTELYCILDPPRIWC